MEPSNPVQTVALEKEETELLRATEKITALYCRLSNEDSLDGESNSYMIRFNFIQHLLKAGAFKVGSGVSVINKVNRVKKVVISRIIAENTALILDAVTFTVQGVLI